MLIALSSLRTSQPRERADYANLRKGNKEYLYTTFAKEKFSEIYNNFIKKKPTQLPSSYEETISLSNNIMIQAKYERKEGQKSFDCITRFTDSGYTSVSFNKKDKYLTLTTIDNIYISKGRLGYITHTSPQDLPTVISFLSDLFDLCMLPIKDPIEKYREIATFEWILQQASPFRWGTPTITKWLVSAIFLWHNIYPLHDCKHNDMNRLSSFTSTLTEYFERYHEYTPYLNVPLNKKTSPQ